jgi:cytoskeletal protein RodZ
VTESYSQGAAAAIGARLRAAREQAGISLEQLIAATRISRSYLVAIEEGHFERLPGQAYVSGFIRLYASQVGLDAEALMQEYLQLRQPAAEGGAVGRPRFRLPAFGADCRRRWGVTVILLVLVLAASFLMDDDRERPPPSPAASTAAPVPQQRLSSAVAPPPVMPAQAPSSAPTPDAEQSAAPAASEAGVPATGIFLRIRADRESWLNIDIDGEMGRQYTLRAGDVIEWKGERRFSLDIGNAGGIQAEFNGKPLGPLGKEGAPVHLELTPAGAE